jgi:penicillin-binding protein 1B
MSHPKVPLHLSPRGLSAEPDHPVATRQKTPRSGWKKWQARLSTPWAKTLIACCLVVGAIALGFFAFFYLKYEKVIDARMRGRIFNNASKIYTNARVVRPGDPYTEGEIIGYLRRGGYAEEGEGESRLGAYKRVRGGLRIQPGPESYHSPEGAELHFAEGKVERIAATSNQQELAAYELEPQLLTALFEGEQRSKRRLIAFGDVPKPMVDAVLAI